MARYRQKNSFTQTLKDYLVPILWGVFILLILIKVFSGGDDTSSNTPTTSTQWDAQSLDIDFNTDDTQAFIAYSWNAQEEIDDVVNLYLWETITVKEWSLQLTGTDGTEISLNKIAEFWYESPNSYSLKSSDAWLNLKQDSNIAMRYAKIDADAGSILSLTQNEAWSSVYVISWNARVSNLSWVSSVLITGQKISISRLNASNEDIDLSGEKWDIDSFFKSSDWFLDNNGHIILEEAMNSTDEEETTDDETPEENGTIGTRVSFNNLRDEMNSEASNLELSGTINSEEVWAITFNNKQASLGAWTFTANVSLTNGVNDIVVKIYDDNRELLEKDVYTVYSSTSAAPEPIENNSNVDSNPSSSSNSQWVTTYEVNANDFGFTEPSVTWKFTTTAWEITIRWVTTAEWISKVLVNGFELGSFNGSTWRYHAFERFETLEEWTNQYKIDYYGEDNNIVYTDYFTIVKQSGWSVEAAPEVEGTQEIDDTAA